MDARYILALEETPKVGRKSIEKVMSIPLLCDPPNAYDLIELLEKANEKFGRVSVPDIQEIKGGLERAKKIWDLSQKHNVQVISRESPNYPKPLSRIPDPPALLHVLGNMDALNNDCIAIVGTREPTEYGKSFAKRLGALFAEKGYVVVSGLAEGIDSAAHRGALEAGGLTVAVLAHGLDTVYPSQNKELAEEILKSNGALVSEYSWGTKINRSNFVERDRIQSGLSLGVLVVETGIDGGTMHTVKFCKDQERSLIVLRHPPSFGVNQKVMGNSKLISEKQADVIFETDNDLEHIKTHLSRVKKELMTGHSNEKKVNPAGSIQTTLA
ncbi:MAG: DNA-processing protein DprA [Deltaproteobacteria bacterium]|nr:DNA-processing protein DprA [Deltaproteobacteria bacterium]